MSLLEVNHLRTFFHTERGVVKAVNDVSFSLDAGKTLGLVGESGSGKSVTAMSILRLLSDNGYLAGGEILFEGKDLASLSERALESVRGNEISMIFQEPMTSLNPVFSVERQLAEPLTVHGDLSRKEAKKRVPEMLSSVGIPSPERVAKQYPHQLSGGMRQRVMIAMALACRPKILIADEPTTALDVTVQAQILTLMNRLQEKEGTAILFITHDLGVISRMADQVAVMYCGQVAESAPTSLLFGDDSVSHPYTEGLLNSLPSVQMEKKRLSVIPGAVPHPLELPKGCKFAPRCPYATQKCVAEEPLLFDVTPLRKIRCFYPEKEERRSDDHRKITLSGKGQ